MADHKKPLAVVAESYKRGYYWLAEQYDPAKWRWNMEASQVRDRNGLVVEAQLVTNEDHMRGKEFRSYVVVGAPSRRLVEEVKARCR